MQRIVQNWILEIFQKQIASTHCESYLLDLQEYSSATSRSIFCRSCLAEETPDGQSLGGWFKGGIDSKKSSCFNVIVIERYAMIHGNLKPRNQQGPK